MYVNRQAAGFIERGRELCLLNWIAEILAYDCRMFIPASDNMGGDKSQYSWWYYGDYFLSCNSA